MKSMVTGRACSLSLSLYRCVSVIIISAFLLPTSSLSQSISETPYQKQEELITALLTVYNSEKATVRALLNDHKSLVTVSLWERLISRAELAYFVTGIEESLLIYDIAIEVAEFLKNKRCLGITHYNTGRAYAGSYRIKDAIQAYLISKSVFEEAGLQRDVIYILAGLGSLYYYLEDYRRAGRYAEQSIKLAEALKDSSVPEGLWPDNYGVASALSTLGGISRRDGDYNQAMKSLQKSLALYQNLAKGSTRFGYQIVDTLADLGSINNEAGRNIDAVIYLNQALSLAQKLPYKDRTARVLNNLGVLYLEQEDYEKAVYYLNQSLQGFQELKNKLEVARALLNLGVVKFRRHHYDQAVENLHKSLKLSSEVSHKDVMIAGRSIMGAIHQAKGNYKTALEELEIGLSLAKEIEDKTRTAEILWRKAEVYYEMGNYGEAAVIAEESLKLATQMRFFNLSYYAASLLGRAQLAQKRSDLAIRTLSQAIEQLEEVRDRVVGREQERILFFENKLTPYHTLIEMLITENKPLDALRYAERAKGRVLLDILRKGRVDITKAMSEKEKEEELSLNRAIVSLNSEMRKEQSKQSPDPERISQLTKQLDSARLKYATFENALFAARPELKTQRGQTPSFTLDSLGYLDPNSQTTFLQYVVTKEHLYLFVLAKKGENFNFKVHTIPAREKELTDRVHKFHHLISIRNLVFPALSRELYDLLLKPIEPHLQPKGTLCIIPDGVLWDVPFQALLSKAGRYLIEDHSIYYAPSFSTLIEVTERKGRESSLAPGGLLALGNPTIGTDTIAQLREQQRGEAFGPLPEAEIEVKTLARILSPVSSRVFVGAAANEKIFKSLAPTSGTIHFATHGVLDNRHPFYSYLVLSRNKSDPNDDGLLEAREIMNLELSVDLAVLSACETARGRIGAGEGVIGMSWAFFVAGCRTTVVSQWKVNSASTSELMINFYRSLKAPKKPGRVSKAEALRQAAMKVMKDRRYQHPYYWAGFVVMGSNN